MKTNKLLQIVASFGLLICTACAPKTGHSPKPHDVHTIPYPPPDNTVKSQNEVPFVGPRKEY